VLSWMFYSLYLLTSTIFLHLPYSFSMRHITCMYTQRCIFPLLLYNMTKLHRLNQFRSSIGTWQWKAQFQSVA
jgi:hypothetical protein